MPYAAAAGLVLSALVVPPAMQVAQADGPNTSYMMTITDDPANIIQQGMNAIDYNYLTYPGFDVFMYNNGYNGTFGDEHLSGITLTMHGQRIAGNGDIHLLPVPEQWDAAAPASSAPLNTDPAHPRTLDRATNTITLPMRYVYVANDAAQAQEWMNYDLVATPEPGGVNLSVVLRDALPKELAGAAAFNLEFIPSLYTSKSYQVDTDGDGALDGFGTLPLAPEDPMDEDWPRAELVGNAWYVDQWNNEKGDAQPSPVASGYEFSLSPEDAMTHISVKSDSLLSIYDGRNRSQNGWFTMSSKIPVGARDGETVAEWHIQAPVHENWLRPVSIAHSQAGYAPGLDKVAVMEIDAKDTNPPATASVLRLNADGSYDEVFTGSLGVPRAWTRFKYRDFDFTSVTAPGSYVIEYDGVRTDVFPIRADVYQDTWQSGLSGFLATAMDHIEVREGYRIWHAASHMDDARMGEEFENSVINPNTNRIQWFDGQQVPMTLPQVVQDKGYDLGDRIDGLNQGGWFDAGDFDIQLSRNYNVLRDLVYDAEAFDNMNDYDTLAVEWAEDTGGTVEMHRPDGVADIVQQIKHGAMQILANYSKVGIVQGTVEVPTLRQYTHLGEGSTDTDGFIYDPALDPDEVVERGGKVYSGINDDRMLMLGSGGGAPTSNLSTVSVSLAGAANVVKDDYPEFAAECLDAAAEIWAAHGQWAISTPNQRANAFNTLVQLMLATEGTSAYAAYEADMNALLALNPGPELNPFVTFLPIATNYSAVFVMDLMGPAFKQNVIDAVIATAPTYEAVADTPFGFTESLTATWGPISGKLTSAQRAAICYETIGDVPGIEPLKDHILMAVNYVLGTHPYNDTSWLVGVGANSHKFPYNSNRADEGFIPGSIVPGYINFRPDFPEALDNFSFLWATNEAIIDYPSRFMVAGLAADKIARQAAGASQPAA
ncbi:MAG: glycoside hydrolase family 9 protein, partial [Bifidobacteriaceae bacterium]|nr:glycoside hydrolase family 9 protein [Bifidobacteriaceae bacterium]